MLNLKYCHMYTNAIFLLENRRGSISAEHGLGVDKNQLIAHYSKSQKVMQFMSNVKKLFDPKVAMYIHNLMLIDCYSFTGYSKPIQNSSITLYSIYIAGKCWLCILCTRKHIKQNILPFIIQSTFTHLI